MSYNDRAPPPSRLPAGVGSHVQSRLYMFAYLGGDTPCREEMEMTVKKFTKEYKFHRCIGDND